MSRVAVEAGLCRWTEATRSRLMRVKPVRTVRSRNGGTPLRRHAHPYGRQRGTGRPKRVKGRYGTFSVRQREEETSGSMRSSIRQNPIASRTLRSSTQSPPARARSMRERTIWESVQPWDRPKRQDDARCFRKTERKGKVEIEGEARKGGHACGFFSSSYLYGRTPCGIMIHLVGDRIGSATLFYHPLYQGPTGFFIIFDGGSGPSVLPVWLCYFEAVMMAEEPLSGRALMRAPPMNLAL